MHILGTNHLAKAFGEDPDSFVDHTRLNLDHFPGLLTVNRWHELTFCSISQKIMNGFC